MTQRSTTLGQVERYCLKTLDHYENAVPYDRQVFQTGIAAHGVLQAIGENPDSPPDSVATATINVLATEGRSFDGVPEPPVPVACCMEGSKLALAWIARHGPPEEGALIEYGAAVDADWNATEYGKGAYYQGIFDVYKELTEEGEDYTAEGCLVRDYKSSWRDGANKTDSTQMHGQSLLALALYRKHHNADPGFIRREIANLRTLQLHSETLYLDDAGMMVLETWRAELDLAIRQAETRPRIAAPGANCFGCPYLTHCQDARAYLRGSMLPDPPDVDAVARKYAIAAAMVAELGAWLKEACDGGDILVPGGSVGYRGKPFRVCRDPLALARAWYRDDPVPDIVAGLIGAIKPGAGSVRRVNLILHPSGKGRAGYKDARAALESEVLETVVRPVFGCHKFNEVEEEENENE